MTKHRLFNIALTLTLGILIVTYVLTVSSLGSGVVYSHDQRDALLAHRQLNLTQTTPLWNTYIRNGTDDTPVLGSTLGATDCQVRATLDARYEEIEGVNATVYDLDFSGTYRLQYAGPSPTTTLELVFPFPQGLDTLNQVHFLVGGAEPADAQYTLSDITWRTEIEAGQEHEVTVRYQARGIGSFRYALDRNRRLDNLDVEITVQGLPGSQVPQDSLPATAAEETKVGEQFTWRYDALIANRDIQITLPDRPSFVQRVERLQGSLRILSQAAPLLVVLFVASLIGTHRLIDVHLPFRHYLLSGCGYFLFYPALTFLSGLLELPLAAAIAATAITVLLLAFLGRVAGWRRTWWQTLLLVAVFLGLFSLGLMSRWRGLLFTVGGVLLISLFMQLIARQWIRRPLKSESTPNTPGTEPDVTEAPPAEKSSPPDAPPKESTASNRHCPHCGTLLAKDFDFCPSCGHDVRHFHRCATCGSEHYIPAETDLSHCPTCGNTLANL